MTHCKRRGGTHWPFYSTVLRRDWLRNKIDYFHQHIDLLQIFMKQSVSSDYFLQIFIHILAKAVAIAKNLWFYLTVLH